MAFGEDPDTDAPIWTPSPARVRNARLTNFQDWLARERGLSFPVFEDLWRWSVDELDGFWSAVAEHFEVPFRTPASGAAVLGHMPHARWFAGAQLNFVDQVFRNASIDAPALIFESEAGGMGELSWSDLRAQVGALAATLRASGVESGDRVAAYLPNISATVVAFLATASLGAIWSVCAPEMGAGSLVDRFRQITPKVLIACDGYRFAGKPFDRREIVAQGLASLESVQTLVWVPHLDAAAAPPENAAGRRVIVWDEAVAASAELIVEATSFEHPLWILYSSGTTGLPKPIVHGHGGVVLNGLVTSALHTDLREGDRFFFSSTTSWMVWNAHVMGLLVGATLSLYDGAPTGPGPEQDWCFLWRLAGRQRIKTFGAGAAFYGVCAKAGVAPGACADLEALETLCSTGSPLPPESYRWIYETVKSDLWLKCSSGGTDIANTFLTGTPTLPVHVGEMQCRNLGAAVEAFDDAGRSLVGEVGELVCTRPLPSMPLCFWNDPGDARLRESYFDTYAGADGAPIWRHGDWLKLVVRPQATGGVIYGRSDATLNRQGVRMGTAELYNVVEASDAVLDSLVVDLEYLGREPYMALFVVLRTGLTLTPDLKADLRQAIRTQLSARHVPDDIVQIDQVPRTLTGKKLELPVKKLMLGQPVDRVVNLGAMSNPESIKWFVSFAADFKSHRLIA